MKLRERMGTAYNAGLEVGGETFLNNYDTYRRYSPWIFMAFMLFFFIIDSMTLVFFCFVAIHLTVLYSQIWWKLRNIEHYYIKESEEKLKR